MKNLKEKESKGRKEEVVRIVEGNMEDTKAQRNTKDSWECSRKHMTKLKKVYENKNTTQEEVDKVIEEIESIRKTAGQSGGKEILK